MPKDGGVSPAGAETGQLRPPLTPLQVLGWIMTTGIAIVVFELALYLAAVTLFTHIDTPSCAGSDTFCSPSGAPGLTGGAMVVLVGNCAAVLVGVALLATILRRRRHVSLK